MKKMNNKGFTIVELVIVIAVIAILAAVMIPTFSGIIDKANESAKMQLASAAYKEAYALVLSNDGNVTSGEKAEVGDFTFTFTDMNNASVTIKTGSTTATKFGSSTVKVEGGKIVIS